jgi:Na+/H+ antiporter NhaD/arsenite permease-like protein
MAGSQSGRCSGSAAAHHAAGESGEDLSQDRLDNVFLLSAFSAVLSNLVSNVPAVLVFKPFVAHLANPRLAWLTLAMSSTLAGNLTVLGSAANLIVIQQARRGVKVGFWEYFRVGAPVAVVTMLLGAVWIQTFLP